MLVREMTRKECADLLSECHLARLACAKDGQPYIVPISIAFASGHLYSFSMPGQKIDWMRANSRVCVEVDKAGERREWRSVIVSGVYEELPDIPKCAGERARAWSLLSRRANWWEPGGLKPEPLPLVCESHHLFYRIRIDGMTGRQAFADSLPVSTGPETTHLWKSPGRWFERIVVGAMQRSFVAPKRRLIRVNAAGSNPRFYTGLAG
jgi:nitroimidazol reductase NimA-like FMN-containing flavoprotein (pyridoxamine 5'-phosphate oxidase superfamily)